MTKDDLTPEEKKIIFHAVRYWQMHKAALNGKEYQTCENILNRWFDDVYTQQKEQQR
jgi:hypothetical protein